MRPGGLPFLALVAVAGPLLSAGLIHVLRPLLVRYALARPSARGLHTVPTPQGGGIAVLATCVAVAGGGAWLGMLEPSERWRLAAVLATAGVLALLGFVDDVRPLPAFPRFAVQLAAMTLGVLALPEGARVLPAIPVGVERALLVLGGTWFVNLTNFMDGMDWITVADAVPVTLWLTAAWLAGMLPSTAGLPAAGLLAGLIGYAPYNRPVAKLFLGDVGSLPLGFLLAYGLFALAGAGHLAPALLLPLYPAADSTITLARRLLRRERIWQPHRQHFYQIAVARGLSVWQVLGRVAGLNAGLALLAGLAVGRIVSAQAAIIVLGATLVLVVLLSLGRSTRRPDGA